MTRFAALTALVVLVGCKGQESEQPPIHLIHNMDTQEKGRAYRKDDTGLFADGRIMRPPVAGTVAQGQLGLDAQLEDGVDEQGAPAKTFPASLKVDGAVPDSLRLRGESRYRIYCAPCHGVSATELGPVAGVALDGGPRLQVPPPTMASDRVKGLVVGKIYAAIKNGVNNGNMPPYAAQVPVEDRWAIVAYVRGLQRTVDPSVQDEGGENVVVAQVTAASAEAGAQLYKAKACVGCHTLDGTRLVGPTFKGLYGSTHSTSAGDVTADDAYLTESMLQPAAKIVTGYPPAMPQLPLTDLEVKSLILFIQAQK